MQKYKNVTPRLPLKTIQPHQVATSTPHDLAVTIQDLKPISKQHCPICFEECKTSLCCHSYQCHVPWYSDPSHVCWKCFQSFQVTCAAGSPFKDPQLCQRSLSSPGCSVGSIHQPFILQNSKGPGTPKLGCPYLICHHQISQVLGSALHHCRRLWCTDVSSTRCRQTAPTTDKRGSTMLQPSSLLGCPPPAENSSQFDPATVFPPADWAHGGTLWPSWTPSISSCALSSNLHHHTDCSCQTAIIFAHEGSEGHKDHPHYHPFSHSPIIVSHSVCPHQPASPKSPANRRGQVTLSYLALHHPSSSHS